MSAARVSLLVPAKDEAENLPEFMRQCAEALPNLGVPYEVVVVNDGSRDATAEVLQSLEATYPFLRVVTHRRQRGIADALRSAGDAASGDIFVFYPADLQYKPEDVPSLVAPILAGDADIVTGTKQGKYEKAFVSSVYNTLCRWLFGIRVTDLNSVKAYRAEVMANVPMRPDWHRFMVVIAAADGFRLTSTPVPLYPRTAGTSKFNWTRIPIGVLDLLSVWFQLRFGRKPMLFFGVAGAVLFMIGFVAGVVAMFLRFGLRYDVALLVSLVQTMLITGVVLFGFGFVGELVAGMREEQQEMARRLAAQRHD
jgi:glycosyltransferase involved in cell wall biosynthesis